MKKSVLASLIVGLFLSSCKDDSPSGEGNDTTKPVIHSFELNGSNEATITAGDTLFYSYSFSDDRELSEAYIEIHENFDGHSHLKANLAWSKSTILFFLGKSSSSTGKFVCPLNVASGPYHVEVSVLDASGNHSDVLIRTLEVQQPGQPQIDGQSISSTFNSGTDYSVSCLIEDDIDIESIEVTFVRLDGIDEVLVGDDDVDLSGSIETSYTYEHTFSTSTSKVGDSYELVLKVVDSDGNHTIRHVDVVAQ